jgi:hypothetical protein
MTYTDNRENAATAQQAPGTGDFEFLTGSWDVRHRRLRSPLTGSDDWDEFGSTCRCWPLFDGAANVDELRVPERGFTGLSLRLLDPARGEWTIYFASTRTGLLQPPVTGRFSGGVGLFYGDDVHDGQDVRVRYTWSGITPAAARWEQAYSPDGEQTWEVNWIMELTRLPTPQ